jgi:hypothetical protein
MKPWYQSKTIWTNIIVAATTFVVAVSQSVSGQTLPVDPAVQGVIVSGFLIVINIILRTITGTPLG